mmetsp:Transcript_68740/g.143559  ORF Transcript_68740/g.143559 Transcript_68740/m.143559 type:complete len:437 (-) Transcript_68740:89-1399(-)
MSSANESLVDAGNTAWVLTSSAFVLLMTPGLAFFYGGLVKEQNVLNTMMMSLISMGVVSMTWMLAGFSLAFGDGGGKIIGDLNYFGMMGMLDMDVWDGTTLPPLVFVVFQMTFAVIGCAIISGSIVERMHFGAFTVFITLWSLVVYAPIAHWIWGPGGWIEELGAKDFAGGAVVHESTAVSALTLAWLLGPRSERSEEPAHNVAFVILGGSLLWFGWSGFNGGSALAADSTAALALINSYQAAAACLVTWMLVERFVRKRWSAIGAVTGAVVGLVIITPAAGFVSTIGAFAMGIIGALMVYPFFQFTSRIDDSLDTFPCHGISGFFGTMLTGCFAMEGGLFYGGGFKLLLAQFVASMAVAAYAAFMSTLIFLFIKFVMRTRVHKDWEDAGLDELVHGESAYVHSPTKSYSSPTKSTHANQESDSSTSESEASTSNV